MPDLSELLDRTTPVDIDPIDVSGIATTARKRRKRRRAGTLIAGMVAVGLVAGVAVTVAHGSSDPRQQVTAVSPDTRTLTPGMGTWTRLPDAPLFRGISLAPLHDGRLLAWGHQGPGVGERKARGDAALAIAIYNPSTMAWSPIDRPTVLDGIDRIRELVAEDRFLVLGSDDNGSIRGAVLDTAAGAWTTIPVLPGIKVSLDAVAWDGTTLSVVRTDPGQVEPGIGQRFGDIPDPNGATINGRVHAPMTRRWTYGSPAWVEGAPPPLSIRIASGSAFDGQRLAIIGGTEGQAGTNDQSLTRADGAIYDIATDAWHSLPNLPWAATNPGVAWIDGRLVVAGGSPDLNGSMEPLDIPIARVAELNTDATRWKPLPAAPQQGANVTWPSATEHRDGGEPLVERFSFEGQPARPEGLVLLDGRWEPTPTRTLHRWDGLVVAPSNYSDMPDSQPFEIQVRRGADDWVPVAKAPFAHGTQPGVAVVGDRIYVVGAMTGTIHTPDASAWVLDLSSTR